MPSGFIHKWHQTGMALMAFAPRLGVQLPQAHHNEPSKPNDLAREAVSCNAGLGRRPFMALMSGS
jgi:hypothetical protein